MNNTRLIEKFKGASIEYHAGIQATIMTIENFLSGEVYRTVCNQALDFAHQNKAHIWISDLRGLEVMKDEDIEWTKTNWYPRFRRSILKEIFIISPQKIFGQASLMRMLSHDIEERMHPHLFADEASVLEFLQAVPGEANHLQRTQSRMPGNKTTFDHT